MSAYDALRELVEAWDESADHGRGYASKRQMHALDRARAIVAAGKINGAAAMPTLTTAPSQEGGNGPVVAPPNAGENERGVPREISTSMADAAEMLWVARADERERCAKVCDERAERADGRDDGPLAELRLASRPYRQCAAAIRALGDTTDADSR